jgi:hypothetical protein
MVRKENYGSTKLTNFSYQNPGKRCLMFVFRYHGRLKFLSSVERIAVDRGCEIIPS